MRSLYLFIALGFLFVPLTLAEQGEGAASELPIIVEQGEMYVYGNDLAPPFVFTIRNETLMVNGIPLSPGLLRKPRPKVIPRPRAKAEYQLQEEMFKYDKSLVAQGLDPLEIARLDSSFLMNHAEKLVQDKLTDMVDSVQIRGGILLLVWWSDGTFETLSTSHRPAKLIPKREMFLSSIRTWKRSLEKRVIIVLTRSGAYAAIQPRSRKQLHEEISLARNLGASFDKEEWAGEILRASHAQRFADPIPIEKWEGVNADAVDD